MICSAGRISGTLYKATKEKKMGEYHQLRQRRSFKTQIKVKNTFSLLAKSGWQCLVCSSFKAPIRRRVPSFPSVTMFPAAPLCRASQHASHTLMITPAVSSHDGQQVGHWQPSTAIHELVSGRPCLMSSVQGHSSNRQLPPPHTAADWVSTQNTTTPPVAVTMETCCCSCETLVAVHLMTDQRDSAHLCVWAWLKTFNGLNVFNAF